VSQAERDRRLLLPAMPGPPQRPREVMVPRAVPADDRAAECREQMQHEIPGYVCPH
jgi:hypothetical protein